MSSEFRLLIPYSFHLNRSTIEVRDDYFSNFLIKCSNIQLHFKSNIKKNYKLL